MPAKIKNITLNIDDKEIKLTLEQAKELQRILNETFGEEKITFVNPYPIVIEHPFRYVRPHWYVDYTTTAGGSVTISSAFTNDESPSLSAGLG